MKLRRLLPILALATAAVPSAVSAEESTLHRIQQAANLDDLQAVIASLGHQVEAMDAPNHSIRAANADGLRYVLTGTACDIEGVPGCRGVAMQILFEGDATFERLAEANLNQVAVTTRYDPQSRTLSVTRYVVLDGGVRLANVAENLRVLLALAPEVLTTALGPREETTKPK